MASYLFCTTLPALMTMAFKCCLLIELRFVARQTWAQMMTSTTFSIALGHATGKDPACFPTCNVEVIIITFQGCCGSN